MKNLLIALRSLFLVIILAASVPSINSATVDEVYEVNGISYAVTLSYGDLAAEVVAGTVPYKGAVKIPKQVTIPGYVKPLGVCRIVECAFEDCTGVTSVSLPEGLLTIKERAFAGCTKMSSVNIPSTCITMEEDVFLDCASLTTISLPKGLRVLGQETGSVDYRIFHGCTLLKSINVASGNEFYSSKNGVLYNHDQTILMRCPQAISALTIPSTVTDILEDACSDCAKITKVSFPSSIDVLGAEAFRGCTKLATIEIAQPDPDPDGSYMTQRFGRYAFADCPAIRSVYLNTLVPPFFEDNDGVFDADVCQKATLYVPEGTAEAWPQIEGWRLFTKIREQGSSGIESIDADEAQIAPVEYYDLNGCRVDEAVMGSGMYIRRQGSKVEKIVIRR